MIGLGIDAGGTYTDGVVFDMNGGKVLGKAKAFTTRHDLAVGIEGAMGQLLTNRAEGWDVARVGLVSLSTTLATNAIVEGMGGIAGLVLIGYDPRLVERLITVKPYEMVSGKHDIDGVEVEPLDIDELVRVGNSLKGKVDALAISSYLAARNPEHEIKARDILSDIVGVPLVCGHELSGELDSIKRATTAALNARLIPTIVELIKSVRSMMDRNGIDAPLMIVKGDGSLMSEEMAMLRPVETILSGPAASIAGATFLAGVQDALILDMGGTTSDLGMTLGGVARVNAQGASVGGHRTCVSAVDVMTTGLGGDSYVQVSSLEKLVVGPKRVIPLSYLATISDVETELDRLSDLQEDGKLTSLVGPCDFFSLVKTPASMHGFNSQEQAIINALVDGPASRYQVCAKINYPYPSLLQTDVLEERGIVIRSAFTPTDALHVLGELSLWRNNAAVLSSRLLGRRLGKESTQFAKDVKDLVVYRLSRELVSGLMAEALGKGPEYCMTCEAFLDQLLLPGSRNKSFTFGLKMTNPIIGIGAPVGAYLPEVSKMLNCDVLLPEHADVANAVGAVTGQVIESVTTTIRLNTNGMFVAHSPNSRREFIELEEALEWADSESTTEARKRAETAGAANIQVSCVKRDSSGKLSEGYDSQNIFIESKVTAVASGTPRYC